MTPTLDIQLATMLLVSPRRAFDAWLDPIRMTQVTGAPARIDPRVGGQYEIWGGSVVGEYVFLDRPRRVAQTWRTEDFVPAMDDSRVELGFEAEGGGTRLTVVHTRIPAHLVEQFVTGWRDHLFRGLQAWVLPEGRA